MEYYISQKLLRKLIQSTFKPLHRRMAITLLGNAIPKGFHTELFLGELLLMKKYLLILVGFTLLFSIFIYSLTSSHFSFAGKYQVVNPVVNAQILEKELIYQEIIFSFLEPRIKEVLADYYPLPINYDPGDVKILSIDRPNGSGTYYFRFKIEVRQYTGPYDRIGIDCITLETASGSRLRATEYKHTDGFDFHNEVRREPLTEDSLGTPKWPDNLIKSGVYHDLTMYLLNPYIDEAIAHYYGQIFNHDPWSLEVLSLARAEEMGKPVWQIKLRVLPYTGPHISIGLDNVTLRLTQGPKVEIVEFEHLESHESPRRSETRSENKGIVQVLSYFVRLFN